jgi:DNA-binding NtrC family response regulator
MDEEATRKGSFARLQTGKEFRLEVTGGPDRGQVLVIDASAPGRQLIGQSVACALRLTDRLASRRHCAVDVDSFGLRVTDQRSTNGTFVNGLRIESVHLSGGERLLVGESQIEVRSTEIPLVSTPGSQGFGPLVGASQTMRRLYPLLDRLAQSSFPVIIEGETGTGKEVLAEALHQAGPRATGPFVIFDCTATASSLIESALFGHEKGAFTGATETRKGVFEQAHGGTLLIDEIGDLDLSLQPKLLRAVQKSEVCRVGGQRWIPVNVRILVATRRNLDREVQAGRFRDDLFFRLNIARAELPPLRERDGDVVLLARHFWQQLGGAGKPVPLDLFLAWEDHDWPGNVRELHNAVARRLVLGELSPAFERASEPQPGDDFLTAAVTGGLPLVVARERVTEEFHRRYVKHLLDTHGGRAADAARAAGVAHRYFNLLRAKTKA